MIGVKVILMCWLEKHKRKHKLNFFKNNFRVNLYKTGMIKKKSHLVPSIFVYCILKQ